VSITIKPFRALRPAPEYVAKVASLPYDVVESSEVREYARNNKLSFLHVDKAEVDFSDNVDIFSPVIYQKAKENLDFLVCNKILIYDSQPNYYIYRIYRQGHVQTGLAGCVSVDDYERGTIKKHELTRHDREQDRLDHIKATKAHASPVLYMYRGDIFKGESPSEIMDKWANENKSVYDFIAIDGARHLLWVVDCLHVQELLRKTFGTVECLYIADGHHRSAAAAKAAQLYKDTDKDTEMQSKFFPAVLFPCSELKIFDHNRVVSGMNGMASTSFWESLGVVFEIQKSNTPVKPEYNYIFGMYFDNGWYKLSLKQRYVEKVSKQAVSKRFNTSVLHDYILNPILGISDLQTCNRIDFVGGTRSTKELEHRVNSGNMDFAFTLYPTSMDDLLTLSDTNEIAPPKSTWFEPKLCSGLLVHVLGV